MHVLTITCTYLTLKNDFSTMWMMTQVMALFTLSILIDEILVLFGNIIVGALIAVAVSSADSSQISLYVGSFAVFLAAINIFGGFLVTMRMLAMYKKGKKK